MKQGVYRGQTAEERSAERRSRLLEATLEVWSRVDGPPVTMTRICQEAGLTERYFYEQFTGLDEALVEVLRVIQDEIVARTAAAIEATEGGPADRARAAIQAFVDLLLGDPRKGRVSLILAPGRPELRPQRRELLRALTEFAVAEAAELYGEEAEPGPEGRLAAVIFIGGLSELVAAWLDGSVETGPADIVEAATRAFTRLAHR